MRIQYFVGALVVCLASASRGQDSKMAAKGFDPAALDRTADACTDFYQFACGGWMKANPIPADQSSWGRWDELIERNQGVMREILEKSAAGGASRNAIDQKIGDYYAACMDEPAVEARGAQALQSMLTRIAALKSKDDLADITALLHVLGGGPFFSFSADQDFKDATQVIAIADQGGIGMPDRDYYLKDDAKSVELRQKYVTHVQKMFELIGDAPAPATQQAQTVMRIETALAKVSMELVKRREPENIYHKKTLKEWTALAPSFAWDRYLTAVGAPPIVSLNVAVPEFFTGFAAVLKAESLDAWKTYLRWHVAHFAARYLSSGFVAQNFDFYGKTLQGISELRPRWKRCVDYTDGHLGEALGERFVERTFGKDGAERTAKLVAALRKSLGQDIKALPWMSDATKKNALAKLDAMATKVGAPAKYRDYTALEIQSDDFVGNVGRGNAFEWQRQLAKIGKPVDRGEWQMSPPTVNAYYNPLLNDINFPVGILQPPFFDRTLDDAVNFGAIGSVIGHEMTHGFDDEGRKFAANGNLQDWWTAADGKQFEKRAACIAEQYSGYTAIADVKLNGQLTLGENTADSGGLRIAYMALNEATAGKTPAPIDGFTAEQRFFIGFGQAWCESRRDEYSRMLAQIDVHSPGRFRVDGTVSNMPEFASAFSCKPKAAMVRENACRVW